MLQWLIKKRTNDRWYQHNVALNILSIWNFSSSTQHTKKPQQVVTQNSHLALGQVNAAFTWASYSMKGNPWQVSFNCSNCLPGARPGDVELCWTGEWTEASASSALRCDLKIHLFNAAAVDFCIYSISYTVYSQTVYSPLWWPV